MFDNDDIIFAYTRAQAIADGVLMDVTETAKEAGFRYPVALTHGAWCECVAVPNGVEGQDEAGRLWDVLNVLRFAIKTADNSSELRFQLHIRIANHRTRLVTLKSVCGPDDDASPCITVMRVDED
jgi:hypothetical protein